MSARNPQSKDFTSKVMADVKKRPRKIGLWNLAYAVPIILAIAVLMMPSTQETIVNVTSQKHVAVANVEDEIDTMYIIMKDIDQFEFDQETEEIINNEQELEE